jgi:site-specific DNA-cytosine methylase
MNVLGLFDGMSCGQIALDKLGVKIDNYFASEIDKYAMQVTKQNYPNTIQLGDVCGIQYENGALFYNQNNEPLKNGGSYIADIDLLIGGSPCQGFSFAGKQLNFDEPRSKLFFEFVRLLKEIKPKYFLLENVLMKKEYEQIITDHLGVEPIFINSALVSAQNRKRLYWTNIPNIITPIDKGIELSHIIDLTNKGDDSCFTTTFLKEHIDFNSSDNQINESMRYQWQGVYTKKMKTLNVGDGARNYIYTEQTGTRKLTPEEAEKCQTVPVGYTSIATLTNRYKMLGNGWTVDVIAHIFTQMAL